MADWRQSLAGVDEDYLVGISNKGIVKRAYKDLEAEGGEARAAVSGLDQNAQELTVAAGGETVTIRLPLGESRCSCPSRSICRHVIMAILLAQHAVSGSDGDETGKCDNQGAVEAESGVSCEHHEEKSEGGGGDCQDTKQADSDSLGQLVWQEILAQPRKPLLRALGSKGLRRMGTAMEADNAPQVERGTVVRMQLPGQDMMVKLLSPLEYSTCTCHKKELCSHKAEAILWCQYLEKQLTAQELAGELEQEPSFDMQELQDTAGQVKDCLEHLLETGLARSGVEQAQELERLAILCHNAGLPGWEGDIRALAE
ncbi:MAG: SWIM zinc finger family protein, partial [Acetatifactor sp.]|nr:SWIM zinc finger family protein [Acetatifactor sp.]